MQTETVPPMKKNYKPSDIPDIFKIKKPAIAAQQIKNSWDSIEKQIGRLSKKGKPNQ
jgi:hypothetical protein